MKAYSDNSNFRISVVGDTGYANNSFLLLTVTDLGCLRVDRNNWDISGLDTSKITRVELSIPSGEFDLTVSSFLIENDLVTFSGYASWDGKQGGLAGMSGYGEFWMNSLYVRNGLFHFYKAGFIKMDPTMSEYNQIKDRSRTLKLNSSDWDAILLEERTVAEAESIPDYWNNWIQYLLTDEAISSLANK